DRRGVGAEGSVRVVGDQSGVIALLIGPVGSGQWPASQFFQLSFNGVFSANTHPDTMMLTSDPLPFGLDGSRGWIISAFVAGNGSLGFRSVEPGFSCKEHYGGSAFQLDKPRADYQSISYFADAAVFSVEAYYPEPGVIS